MKNKLRTFGHIILCLVCIIIGFLISKIVKVPGITFAKELNPLHGISILFTLFIAIYVSLMLDKHKESKKIQRDLVFDRIHNLLECINSINIDKDKFILTEVTSTLKKIGIQLNYVKKFIKLTNITKKEFKDKFDLHYKKLKDLMTNTPITEGTNGNPPIECVRGKLIYNSDRKREIELQVEQFKNLIFDLQFEIAIS